MWTKTKDNTLTPQEIGRYNWVIWKVIGGCFAFLVLMITLTWFGVFGTLPSFRDLENPKSNLASQILSDDKELLGTYYVQNRSPVTYKDLSKNVIEALVATEDKRFYLHSGIDFEGLFRGVLYTIIGKKQGGSTITQQLALAQFSDKGHEHNRVKRVIQKLQEWIISVQLERRYTKEEILTMYFNSVDFGAYNTYGIRAASHTYFNTTPDKLTPEQAALLVGMLNAPGLYSPINHPDRAITRRNLVLHRMAQANYLSDGQVDEFQKLPLALNFHPSDNNQGPAPYFRAELLKDVQNILEAQNINKNGQPYDLYRDGLKIYTTVNSKMQQYAEEAQKEYMQQLQVVFNNHWKGYNLAKKINNYQLLMTQGKHRSDRYIGMKADGSTDDEITKAFDTPVKMNIFSWHGNIDTVMKPNDSILYCKMLLQNSLLSMDPTTGYVKAWVGGINFEHFKYDHVRTGTRQVGSTAKPFTYAVAIQNGYSPCMEIPNVPVTITGYGAPWTPASQDTKAGILTLRTALAYSQNWITAYIMNEVKPEPVVQLIKNMGITTDVPPYPSICLGTFNASLLEMTGAYSIFANQGIYKEPTYILRIEDKNGNVLYTHTPKTRPVMNEQHAYVMTYMLKGVIEDGTGSRLRGRYGLTNPIAGKTGTPQDNSDGWFIGMTPQLVTGVWTGCEDRDFHFRTTSLGEGANSALPVFALYMKKVYADPNLGIKKNIDFALPKDPLTVTIDCGSYKQQQQQPTTNEADKKLNF
jgi:penicillin-binding protein 1A